MVNKAYHINDLGFYGEGRFRDSGTQLYWFLTFFFTELAKKTKKNLSFSSPTDSQTFREDSGLLFIPAEFELLSVSFPRSLTRLVGWSSLALIQLGRAGWVSSNKRALISGYVTTTSSVVCTTVISGHCLISAGTSRRD